MDSETRRMDEDDVVLRFGRNVRRVRRAMEMSQEKLAELANLHRTYVSELERGIGRNPTVRAAHRIAVALEVPIADLFV